jgi:hypothetical protein
MDQRDMAESEREALVVLFHASLLGRTDIVSQAISTLRSSCSGGESELSAIISTGRDNDGATPLHLAVSADNADVIRALLNAGASPTAETARGERPYEAASETSKQAFHVFLFEAIAMGRVDAVRKLLAGGVPVSVKDGSALTGLFRREEGAQIIFVDAAGKEVSIDKSRIAQRTESATSLMPEIFADTLSPDDFHNLMAFLLSQATTAR